VIRVRRVGRVLRLARLLRAAEGPETRRLFDHLWLDGRPIRTYVQPAHRLRHLLGRSRACARHDRADHEIPVLYFDALTSRPFWPADDVSRALETEADAVRAEFDRVDGASLRRDRRDEWFVPRPDAWTVLPLFDGYGRTIAETAARCPRTAALAAGLPGAGEPGFMAYFSVMQPHTHIRRHVGRTNLRLRYHLGLEVPERDVYLRVHDRIATWHEGRCIVFDDSYEHEVFQQSDRRRVVLIVDAPHPDLTAAERAVLGRIMRVMLDGSMDDVVYDPIPDPVRPAPPVPTPARA
jgi:aspartate beta-hydroxylase